MTPTAGPIPTDLLAGVGTGADADFVDGHDFYGDDNPDDSSYQDPGDPISAAVGTPGYMSAHVVGECYRTLGDGATTEPAEFDRFYFPPQEPGYDGPAPVLLDILDGVTPDELEEARSDKDCEFKAAWCRSHGIRYVVLTDSEDLFLSPEQLRARMWEAMPPQTVAETAQEPVDLDAAVISYQHPAPGQPSATRAKPRSRKPATRGKPGSRRAGIQRPGAGR